MLQWLSLRKPAPSNPPPLGSPTKACDIVGPPAKGTIRKTGCKIGTILMPQPPHPVPISKPVSSAERCWLVKSEPDSFSIHDLASSPRQTICWDGVRNYQARNFLRAMQIGDRVLFYHSSAEPPAVAGTAVVVGEAYPDSTAWDPRQDHYDPKSRPDEPIWFMVDLRLEEIFAEPLGLDRLREVRELAGMELLRKGSRLSVQPVTPAQFEKVLELAATAMKVARKPPGAKKRPPKAKPSRK